MESINNAIQVSFYSNPSGGQTGAACPVACTTPVMTEFKPIGQGSDAATDCITWPGNSGENSQLSGRCVSEDKYEWTQFITCDCSGTPTVKNTYASKCVIDKPPTLCSKIVDIGACGVFGEPCPDESPADLEHAVEVSFYTNGADGGESTVGNACNYCTENNFVRKQNFAVQGVLNSCYSWSDASSVAHSMNSGTCVSATEFSMKEYPSCDCDSSNTPVEQVFSTTSCVVANPSTHCVRISDIGACAVKDCVASWTAWSSCSKPCGGGSQTRTYHITSQPENGGIACAHVEGYTETQACNSDVCSVDCIGYWSDWTSCTVTCGGPGSRTKTYIVTTEKQGAGAACEAAHGDQVTESTCGTATCPVPATNTDCVGSWGDWSAWTGPCGAPQTRTRTYTISAYSSGTGANCMYADGWKEQETGSTVPCPVDCQGSWSEWGDCSVACGTGTHTRTWTQSVAAANGGQACPQVDQAEETGNCNTQNCPVNCVGSWSAYGACSATCGSGSQTRTYTVSTAASDGGLECAAANGAQSSRPCLINP